MITVKKAPLFTTTGLVTVPVRFPYDASHTMTRLSRSTNTNRFCCLERGSEEREGGGEEGRRWMEEGFCLSSLRGGGGEARGGGQTISQPQPQLGWGGGEAGLTA